MMDTEETSQAPKLTHSTPTHTHRDNDDNDKAKELVAAANVVAWLSNQSF